MKNESVRAWPVILFVLAGLVLGAIGTAQKKAGL